MPKKTSKKRQNTVINSALTESLLKDRRKRDGHLEWIQKEQKKRTKKNFLRN